MTEQEGDLDTMFGLLLLLADEMISPLEREGDDDLYLCLFLDTLSLSRERKALG